MIAMSITRAQLPSECFLQFLKLMEGTTGFLTQKKFSKDFFNLEICYKYDFK